jgi:hypothetical protein
MTRKDEEAIRLKRMADGNKPLMDGTTRPVKKIIKTADLVFGIWRDASAPDGVGRLIIKGEKALREVIASGKTVRMRTTAIWCANAEHAAAAKRVFGSIHLADSELDV